MTDFEFNAGLERFIILCENKTIQAKDLGDFFSMIYGIGGNTIRIRLFLPAVMKISRMIYKKCMEVKGIYSWDKNYYIQKLAELEEFQIRLKGIDRPDPEFIIDLIDYLAQYESTNDEALAYRVVFTGMKDDIKQDKLIFSSEELNSMKSTFEEMLRI